MLDDDSPGVGVDFYIDPTKSEAALIHLAEVMQSTEAKVLADSNRIEKATGSMVDVSAATASLKTFAASATDNFGQVGKAKEALDRILANAVAISGKGPALPIADAATTAEINRTEKAIDGLVLKLNREAAAIGLTRDQQREKRIETLALTAAEQGNSDAADRLLAASRNLAAARQAEAERTREVAMQAQAAAEANEQFMRRAAQGPAMFEAAAARFARAARDEEQALAAAAKEQLALAAAAERLRAELDPAVAAQQRFDKAMGEARTLIGANAISLDEYCAKLRIERQALEDVGQAQQHVATTSGAQKAAMQNLGFQIQDFSVQVVGGTSVLRAFAMQAPQAAGALTGFEGTLGKVGAFLAGPWGIALTVGITLLAGFADALLDGDDAAKKATDSLKAFQDRQNDIANFIDTTTGKLIEQNRALVLNAALTRQKQIADNEAQISEGRNAAFRAAGNQQTRTPTYTASSVGTPIMMRETDPDVQRAIKAAGGNVDKLAQSIAQLAATKRPDLKPLALDISNQAGAAIMAQRENDRLGKEIRALNGDTTALASSTTTLIGKQVALATATTPLAKARAQLALVEQGAAAADKAGGAALTRYRTDLTAATKAVNDAEAAQKAAAKAKGDATKASNQAAAAARRDANHAAELDRDATAIEAQVRNLYALADAYGVSGAAALIAEARVKAESQAIRARGDIEAAVDRQIRLSIAQRVADADKGAAAMREQARVQTEVNGEVAAGNIPAERAAELLRDRIAELPLLQAVEAAQQRGLTAEVEKATAALEAQRSAQADAKAAAIGARFLADDTAADRRLAELGEELRLVGATDVARTHALATLKATNEALAIGYKGAQATDYIDKQVKIADAQLQSQLRLDAYNAGLHAQADLFDTLANNAANAGRGMADAFGDAGRALGDLATTMAGYMADQQRLHDAKAAELQIARQITDANVRAKEEQRINGLYAARSASTQIGLFGDLTASAKGFFKEGSDGYRTLAGAEKAFRLAQFAMSVRAIAQDAIETGSSLANSAARTAANAVEAVTKAISSLPFPANIAAGAATVAALAAIGVSIAGSFGGGKNTLPKANEGTGTVLGDSTAKSESIKNAIDALREVDLLTNSYSRQMAASLKSIDSQIGNVAALVVRAGDVDANDSVTQGFKTNAVGSVLKTLVPVFGGALASLFGTKTTVVGNGLYAGAQTLGSILDGGFDASYYSDVQKKKKLFGITTSTKYSTQYSAADAGLENQFTLILKQFNTAIAAAAGPLGASTSEIQQRLNGFVVNLGKIDLKDLTGEQIQEKLTAVFGAAADDMAKAAFPGFERFQKVGEGAFETLVRVSSTVEAVTTALGQLGAGARSLGIDAKIALADQFDSISDLTSAVDSYFTAYFSKEEQAAAKTAQLASVFGSLGLSMPATLAGFRGLVEAQDLTTAAGQATYATLLKLGPAFADLQTALNGAKSAADIASERQGLERQLLELRGDTAAIRALDLAKLDASNRVLQEQIWAIQDAQEAAKAADELRQAWTSVGDSIMDEVKRIRGLTDASGGNSFASLMGQFNAANAAARGGDMDAAKTLPQLSQALLSAAANAATSRQELDRVRAQTAAALEATYGVVGALTAKAATSTTATVTAAAEAQGGSTAAAANDDVTAAIDGLRDENAGMRRDLTVALATIAGSVGRVDRRLEAVTSESGGNAVTVTGAAA